MRSFIIVGVVAIIDILCKAFDVTLSNTDGFILMIFFVIGGMMDITEFFVMVRGKE